MVWRFICTAPRVQRRRTVIVGAGGALLPSTIVSIRVHYHVVESVRCELVEKTVDRWDTVRRCPVRREIECPKPVAFVAEEEVAPPVFPNEMTGVLRVDFQAAVNRWIGVLNAPKRRFASVEIRIIRLRSKRPNTRFPRRDPELPYRVPVVETIDNKRTTTRCMHNRTEWHREWIFVITVGCKREIVRLPLRDHSLTHR